VFVEAQSFEASRGLDLGDVPVGPD
jgi:hypothetical protein